MLPGLLGCFIEFDNEAFESLRCDWRSNCSPLVCGYWRGTDDEPSILACLLDFLSLPLAFWSNFSPDLNNFLIADFIRDFQG